NAIIDSGNPLHVEDFSRRGSPSLASFENYKMDVLKSAETASDYVPDHQTLSAMYEAAKADKIQSVQHRTRRSIIVDSIVIALCIVFFSTHWMWMRRLSAKAEARGGPGSLDSLSRS
ncbi:MAG: hypothetical protein ACC700_18835, partial [Anaerolineales bacterium]